MLMQNVTKNAKDYMLMFQRSNKLETAGYTDFNFIGC